MNAKNEPKWMIYGANGFTGSMIARMAHMQGLTPILAGRNDEQIVPLATELNASYRIFSLEDKQRITDSLSDIDLLLNCAGPFAYTATELINGCLENDVHYIDITGEIDVFELAQSQHDRARKKRKVLCPGVGFDVVPTDCISATLKNALPDAESLTLGFDTEGELSVGTTKTSLLGAQQGGITRQEGKLCHEALGSRERDIDFGTGIKHAVAIPWGDLATAWFTTGIGNIEVYMSASPERIRSLKRLNWMRPLLRIGWIKQLLLQRIGKQVQNPTSDARLKAPCYVWGEVRNNRGNSKQAFLSTPNGYDLTVTSALAIVRYLLEYDGGGGYFTPSRLMGTSFVESLPGCSAITVISYQQGVLDS
ncbi:saccharopine dehydrogenase NADP-binding domain-containing protein [Aestuariirhabdus sp. Z084]|uniref:saccharopine dehydrogenase family protein n=1 Tax=Aestuariirhabdus haliotis TaxID=2918751 RepID=UPI00201B3BBC|nr:saccharopine dehydrogenase NADP-binding domain-containing protein [Aestuariirhabdus haliotis]MCL6417545.1 saccharopine dehydrogenase NADP-binding domain-containing protein [Aestuariirhabdus haliotis]MCL6421500.1 saccharopine dehydrogenase NADP-binding domain-containing protein [Aestuariirhabdus haliotis]